MSIKERKRGGEKGEGGGVGTNGEGRGSGRKGEVRMKGKGEGVGRWEGYIAGGKIKTYT